MANTIGDKELYVEGSPSPPKLGSNSLSVAGHYFTELSWVELWEIFRRCPGGYALNTVIGRYQIAHDLTEDSVLTQYCSFDDTRLVCGWYILTGFDAPYENLAGYYPYSLGLFFLGTTATLVDSFSVEAIEEAYSDWGI